MNKLLAWFISITLVTELAGLYVGYEYIGLMQSGIIPPVIERPSEPTSALLIFVYVLFVTACILLVIKFFKRKELFIRGIETLAVFFASWVVFDLFLPFGFVPAILLVVWRALKPNHINKTLATMLTIIGAGAMIGSSLDVFPALILVVLLSSYDFIAVFVTKHMVYMARAMVETDSAFTFSFPHKFKKPVIIEKGGKNVKVKEHTFQLGGGDVLLPIIFSVSVLRQFTFFNAVFSLIGSVVALTCLFYIISKRVHRPLPALPVVSAGMLIGFAISLLL